MEALYYLVMILLIMVDLYLTYRNYIREKYYSGKKFIWSKKDRENINLKGFHFFQKTLLNVIITFAFIYIFLDYKFEFNNILFPIYVLLLFLIYVVVSLVAIENMKTKEPIK